MADQKRITDQASVSNLSNGDYVLVDNTSTKTHKYNLGAALGDLSELETTDKSSIVNAINEARGTGGGGVTSVNGRTGAVTGLQEALTEVTIATSGAVTQALEPNKIYHFTSDALTALTVSSTAPTEGRYEFDFISGSTAPTVTMPSSWVMPNNFIIEPNGKYRLVIDNGYCVADRWANNHSPFTYVDVESGAFVVNASAVTVTNIYANIGTEIVSINLSNVKNKSELANNKYLKICTISADTKALIGGTYVIGSMPAGTTGKMVEVIFNTWQTGAEIQIHNITGEALPANTVFAGVMFVLRTL